MSSDNVRDKKDVKIDHVFYSRTPDYFLHDNIHLEMKERELLMDLLKKYIHDKTNTANLYFDNFINEYQHNIFRAITILREISRNGILHRKSIGLDGGFTDDERVELGIDKEGYLIEDDDEGDIET